MTAATKSATESIANLLAAAKKGYSSFVVSNL
jgi:hypothetical protein